MLGVAGKVNVAPLPITMFATLSATGLVMPNHARGAFGHTRCTSLRLLKGKNLEPKEVEMKNTSKNIPGFTAEASLRETNGRHRLEQLRGNATGTVLPQLRISQFPSSRGFVLKHQSCEGMCASIANDCTYDCDPRDGKCRSDCDTFFWSCLEGCRPEPGPL